MTLPPRQIVSQAGASVPAIQQDMKNDIREYLEPEQDFPWMNIGWTDAPQPSGRRAAAVFQQPVKVSQASPIFDSAKLDNTDLDAEEAITRAERAMSEGDRDTALAAVREAEHLLINATVIEKVMSIEAGSQL